MKTNFRQILMLSAAVLVACGMASAAQINGSLGINLVNLSQNGADLSVSTLLSASNTPTNGAGVGDYSPVPTNTDFGPITLDLTSLGSFTMSNATYGSFASSSGIIVSRSANFLDVYLDGTFTPGSGLPGLDPTDSSLRFSFTQSGQSVSGSFTLNSPALRPPGVPEPATLSLMGGALLCLGFLRRKRA